MKAILFSLLIFTFSILNAQLTTEQQNQINSLQKVINTTSSDTTKISALKAWDDIIYISDPDLDLNLNKQIIEICENNLKKKLSKIEIEKFNNSISNAYNNIGSLYKDKSDFKKALEYFQIALKIHQTLNNKINISISYNNIGTCYQAQGDLTTALKYFKKSLNIDKKIANKEVLSLTYSNIGMIYLKQKNNKEAMDYFQKGLKIAEEINYYQAINAIKVNIGSIYYNQDNYEKALEYFQNSLILSTKLGDKKLMAFCVGNIGTMYLSQKNHEKALEYLVNSVTLFEELGNKTGIAQSCDNIGQIYKKQEKYKQALFYTKKSLSIAQEIGAQNEIKDASYLLYEIYKLTNDNLQALKMHEQYVDTKDSLTKVNAIEEGIRLEEKRKFSEQNLKDSLQHENEKNVINVKHDSEMDQEENKRYFLYGGLVLFLVFSTFIFNRFIVTRKQKQIIEKQKDQVEIQKQEVEEQKQVVDEKNKEIIDSITYAKRLQDSILPQSSTIKKLFPDSFILFKSKDIVSGDFYWVKESNGKHLISAIDCTGHGVPGAFMSLIGANGLNDAVEKHQLSDPGGILNELNRSAYHSMNKGDENVNVRDGMDLSLCAIDYTNLKLSFSGAGNPIYHVRNNELNIIKGDRFAIGSFVPGEKTYTTHEISVLKGDMIYLFSDGYADQFGGLKGKKFMYKKFRDTLLSINNKKVNDQKSLLENTLNTWMGSYDQIDDILVIGIRI